MVDFPDRVPNEGYSKHREEQENDLESGNKAMVHADTEKDIYEISPTCPTFDDSESSSICANEENFDAVPRREPFFAFLPKVANFGSTFIQNEFEIAKRAIVSGPSFTAAYIQSSSMFYKENPRTLLNELISGFTVAIMQIPESIAFAFVAGVPPLSGLQASFWMAMITGIFGGKPGMVSGIAGSLAVVLSELSAEDGTLGYLDKSDRLNAVYLAVFCSGIAQILFAWMRMAKLVRLISHSGMIGLMNGLAIIIFLAQLPSFMKCEGSQYFVDCKVEERQYLTFSGDTWVLVLTLAHVFLCMGIMKFYPLMPNIGNLRIGKILPSSLVSLLFGTMMEHTLFRQVLKVSTRTVGETAPMDGSWPVFNAPFVPTDAKTLQAILMTAVTLSAIGSVESVLTLEACNEITDKVPKLAHYHQEIFAQGLGNILCGLFNAIGGDPMIGQSTINIMNGAKYRMSSTSSGLFMLAFIVFLSPSIELLPIPTLTGVLFMVVLSTFQWKTFIILRYGRMSDSATILIVTLVAVFQNLAVAMLAGIVFKSLVYAWDSGSHVTADIQYKQMLIDGEECQVKYLHVRGVIFFSSARTFIDMFSVSDDPDIVIIDLKDGLVIDHSAVAALQGIMHRFHKAGKRVLLTNIPHKCHGRLGRTGDHDVLKRHIANGNGGFIMQDVHGHIPIDGAAVEVKVKERGGCGQEEGEEEGEEGEEGEKNIIADEATFGGMISELPMFDVPMESVDQQLMVLEEIQGSVVIDSVKKDN